MEQIKVGSGLNNLGNTCFFNAVMQSVLHTKKLALYLASKNHSKNCQKSDWCVFCQMQRTYHATRNTRSYSPGNLVNNLKKIFKKFKLGRQEDSHEFLRYLIEGMQDCQTGKLGKERQKNEIAIKKTKIFNFFGGVIKNVVLCLSCKHKSITKQRYYDLNIECQKSNSIDEGLEKFFAADELKGSNKYLCESCKNRVDATKRFYLESAPQTLTFQLKRFTNMLRKIGKFIKYPKFVHLGKYFDHERKTVARLSAVIVHAGSCASSGHYYAYVRVGQDWFRMDDSYVTKCSEQQAMNQNAYILLYEKVKDESLQKQQKEEVKSEIATKKQNEVQKNQVKKDEQLKRMEEQFQKRKQQNKQKDDEKTNSNSNDTLKQLKMTHQHTMETENGKTNTTQTEQITIQVNQFKRSSPVQNDDDDEELVLPGKLQRKRSKQQAQQEMSLQEVMQKYATNLYLLRSKIPPPHMSCRSLRPIYNLRKYQISMKKRKFNQ